VHTAQTRLYLRQISEDFCTASYENVRLMQLRQVITSAAAQTQRQSKK